jgi:NAD(P)-dependent dehydrogenase (short-subunit alcohol dehydrogenase family)
MKNVIISGANGNLGKFVTKKFMDEGWHVDAFVQPGTYMEGFEKSELLKVIMVDLAFESEVNEIAQKVMTERKQIDACVMLAGGFVMSDFTNTDYELLQRMFHLNFFTAYNLVSNISVKMMSQPDGGQFVFMGAKPALDAEAGKGAIAYALSKSLLFELSELLNAEGKDKNISSAVVVPSIIDTPANRNAMPDADFSQWIQPDKLASLIFSICNKEKKEKKIFEIYKNE